jgi:ABC-type multidrug transport system ATPase subunit
MGASGCGKTTLISCIVGVQSLERGCIEVFGEGVGKNNAKIGYMPQDISMVSEFTIKEMIHLYGKIFNMSRVEINQRLRFLQELLDLPDADKFIGNCSGGQQRRVSFALTLVHEPEILILDEPTVGVDPLLRHKIWDYLMEITSTKNVTVLVSTHYIEEAKHSTHIGLMRNGVQIAEDSPQNILSKWETTSLEEAFLKMSQKQENDNKNQNFSSMSKRKLSSTTSQHDKPRTSSQTHEDQKYAIKGWKVLHALLIKNALQFIRHPGFVYHDLFIFNIFLS